MGRSIHKTAPQHKSASRARSSIAWILSGTLNGFCSKLGSLLLTLARTKVLSSRTSKSSTHILQHYQFAVCELVHSASTNMCQPVYLSRPPVFELVHFLLRALPPNVSHALLTLSELLVVEFVAPSKHSRTAI